MIVNGQKNDIENGNVHGNGNGNVNGNENGKFQWNGVFTRKKRGLKIFHVTLM